MHRYLSSPSHQGSLTTRALHRLPQQRSALPTPEAKVGPRWPPRRRSREDLLFEVAVDVDDQVDGGARRLPDKGGQVAAEIQGDDRVVGPGLARRVVDAGDVGHRLAGREEPEVPRGRRL